MMSVFNVQTYGAVGDGVTNDRAAIQATISACPTGGTVYLPTPAVGYLLAGTGTELLLINKNINFVGEHMGLTKLLIAASVGSSVDVIRVYGTTGYLGQRIENFTITPVSGIPARHGIYYDISHASHWQACGRLARVNIEPSAATLSFCIIPPT